MATDDLTPDDRTLVDLRLEDLSREITRYLAEHPAAADSVEGIRRWWLLRQRLDEAAAQVQRALDRLEAAGQVRKQVLPDGTAIYGAVAAPTTRKE